MDKTTIHMVPEPRKTELVNACFPIIGAIFEVYKTLGPGLPEYIYQEALLNELNRTGLPTHKELEYHPMYKGQPLQAFLKMDFVVETFGYLRATGWPVALLVNFGTSPKARIERYYNDHGTICVF